MYDGQNLTKGRRERRKAHLGEFDERVEKVARPVDMLDDFHSTYDVERLALLDEVFGSAVLVVQFGRRRAEFRIERSVSFGCLYVLYCSIYASRVTSEPCE